MTGCYDPHVFGFRGIVVFRWKLPRAFESSRSDSIKVKRYNIAGV